MKQSSQAIEAEIIVRLGFVPPFFHAARPDPYVFGQLWRHTLSAYLDNPLPSLFKEKLTAILSRHCAVPYCLMCHSASMRPLGIGGVELLHLLAAKNPFLAAPTVQVPDDGRLWTHPGSWLETWVLACSEAIFLHMDWERAQASLRETVGETAFNRILMLISYVRACLDWISAHPQVRHQDDKRVQLHLEPLMAEEPGLALFFAAHSGPSQNLAVRWMNQDSQRLLQELQKSNDALKQREESMRRLMDATPCIVWETNGRGEATFFNAVWYQYTQRAPAESLGRGAIESVHPHQRDAYLSQWRQHQADSTQFEIALQLRRSDAKYRWFLVRMAPVRNAEQRPQKWLGTALDVEDITVLKKTEAELNAAIIALESQKAVRERFVSALSHDLRAPIAVGLMSSQLICRKGAADSAYVLRVCKRIEASMTRADRMIHDLLDANRIEAGQQISLVFEPTRMDALLAGATADLNQIHSDCVVFRNEAGAVQGTWDAGALRRVIDNLVANAIKYGKRNSAVTLTLNRLNEGVELQVHNQGHAIAPCDQERLFTPYARTQSAIESGQQGWGIGLAVVKEIAALHGGRVSVDSSETRGTTFSIKLPMDSARANRARS